MKSPRCLPLAALPALSLNCSPAAIVMSFPHCAVVCVFRLCLGRWSSPSPHVVWAFCDVACLLALQVALSTGRLPPWVWQVVETAPGSLPRSLRMFWFRATVFGLTRGLQELQESEAEAASINQAAAGNGGAAPPAVLPESVAAAQVLARRGASGGLG